MYSQPSDYVSLRPFPLFPILWKCLLVGLHWLGEHTNSWRLPLMTSLFTVGSNMDSVYRKACHVTLPHLEMTMFRMKHLILYFFKQEIQQHTVSEI